MPRPARIRLVLLAAVLVAAAGAVAYFYWPHGEGDAGPGGDSDGPAPDPRLTFDTPFRNVRPDVAYAGDAACAECHQDICDTYHRHAMGRSAFVMPAPDEADRYGPAGRTEFAGSGNADYRVERKRGQVVHVEVIKGADGAPVAVTPAVAVLAIGSGTRGRSYVCERGGALWQSAVSWFGERQIWDLSPGFVPGRHALRPVGTSCLFCHVNLVDPIPEAGNRFREPLVGRQAHIGCERCHGPGALHVAERKAGVLIPGTDTAIVNPRRLPAPLREDVCRQCHLQGELRVGRRGRGVFDYRPGLPLGLFLTVFVRRPDLVDYHKSVGQVEQMAVSRCFAGSGGQLGCTSCHDPHASPAPSAKAAFYRDRCLTCHRDKGCSLPVAARQVMADACTVCHMPKAASANIAHTAVTDHRILRTLVTSETRPGGLPQGGLPVVVAPGPGTDVAGAEELDRDLGIALANLARRLGGDNPGALTAEAVRRLTTATARHPSDTDAWAALAGSHLALGDTSAALVAAERAAANPLASDAVLDLAAGAAAQAGRWESALEYARRAVAANPAQPDYRVRLADVLLQTGRFAEAEAQLRELLDACPSHIVARTLLAVALHMQGRARDAVAEVERAAHIAPPQSNALRTMFRSRIR